MSKKILGKGDGNLIVNLFKESGVKADFSDDERTKLINYFNNKELNQFYLVIIQKVLSKKSFTLDNHNVITGLLSRLTKTDIEKLFIRNSDDVIKAADTLFKTLMTIDIEAFYTNEF